MTTEELIKVAKKCSHKNHCPLDCPYLLSMMSGCEDELLAEVTDRLEKAYTDLKEQGYCSTCKYSDICSGGGDADTGCNGSDKWEWEGDNSD